MKVLKSFNSEMPKSYFDEVWAKEADARVEAYERGEVDTIPAEEVLAKYNQEVD